MMKAKLTILAVLVLILTVGVAQADVNFTDDTILDLTGANDLTVKGVSEAEQVVVNAGDIDVTLDGAGGNFTVTAPVNLTVTGQTSNLAIDESCATGNVTLLILNPQGSDEVVTITPQAASCSAGGGGGGGGGGGAATPSTPTTPTTPSGTPSAPVSIPSLPANPTSDDISNVLNAATQQLAYIQANLTSADAPTLLASLIQTLQQLRGAVAGEAGAGAGSSVPPDGSYTSPMSEGSTGDDVSALQNFLTSQGPSIYSQGLVTGYFGPLTERAVQLFQEREGIAGPGDPGYGFVGPQTRARINAILGL